MPDDYQELDVFGRPVSKVAGVPYVTIDDEDAALREYVASLVTSKPIAAKPEGFDAYQTNLPWLNLPAHGKYDFNLTDRQIDEFGLVTRRPARRNAEDIPSLRRDSVNDREAAKNPIVLFPGMDRRPIEYDDWENIKTKIFGPRKGQMVNALGSSVRMPARASFNERFGIEPEPERYQMWPEKMVRSGTTLPIDVIEGRVKAEKESIERTQDLAGLATGGMLVTGTKAALPSKLSNVIGRGYKATKRVISTLSDDELGTAINGLQARKDLTEGSFGGNVPPEAARSAARNIGRESMPEILARQRASEGYEAAIRDPETKKLYTGMWHEEVLDKIAKERGVSKEELPANLRKGYVDYNGKFWTEAQMEAKSRSKTAMFRADDEVGAAVAALHASEGKAPELKPAEAAPTGNLPAVVPQRGLGAPGTAVNPIASRRGFLRGARDLMAAASNANKIVTMAEKLAQPMPVPKMPKVPLKEIWKSRETIPEVYDMATENFWYGYRSDFEKEHPEFTGGHVPKGKEKAYDEAIRKFEEKHEETISDIAGELEADWEGGGTQFSHNQLPGGTNYREHLLQMPERERDPNLPAKLKQHIDRTGELAGQLYEKYGADWRNKANKSEIGQLKEVDDAVNKIREEITQGIDQFFGSYDEPDVLTHTRINDRTLPGGGKALHVEGTGSEIHDAGKERGYKKEGATPPDVSDWSVKQVKKATKRSEPEWSIFNKNGKELYRYEAKNEKEALEASINAWRSRQVPDLPFKNTHPDLVANRMLHEATTQGYDALSWTPHDIAAKWGDNGNKAFHERVEALAKKYGGKIEKQPVESGLADYFVDETRGKKFNVMDDNIEVVKEGFATEKEARAWIVKNTKQHEINVLRLTPEMKRIFGHDDFSMFPKQKPGETDAGFKLRSDSEAGAAVGALHASEGKAPELKVGEAAPTGNLPAVVPPQGLAAPGSAINPDVNRRGFLRGARDLMAAASNANKIVTMVEKLAQPTPVPKMLKVPLKEIWKSESDYPSWVYDTTDNPAWEYFNDNFVEGHPQYSKYRTGKDGEFDTSQMPESVKVKYNKDRDKFQAQQEEQFLEENKATWDEIKEGGTQFSHNQLPGGTNYREHLMHMPEQRQAMSLEEYQRADRSKFTAKKASNDEFNGKSDYTVFDVNSNAVGRIMANNEQDAIKKAFISPPAPKGDPFYGTWDEPDVIAHTRINDRELPGGGKALHVEGTGSEIHDAGAKKGYGLTTEQKQAIKVTEDFENKLRKKYGDLSESVDEQPKYGRLSKYALNNQDRLVNLNASLNEKLKRAALYEKLSDLKVYNPNNKGIPDLPFKTTHPDLVANRMLHEAATQGYDALSWTTPEFAKKEWGDNGVKAFHDRVEALAKKYGGKIEDHKVVARHDVEGKPSVETMTHVLRLTPEMKRVFGHDDFSMFPKQKPGETDAGFKLRSDSEAGAAVGALRNSGSAPTFYSGLARTLERAPFEEATPSQWAKYLRDTVGARQAEEFEHVGLEGKVGKLEEQKVEVQRPAQQALDTWKQANQKQRPPKELMDAASNENKRIVEQKLKDKDTQKPLTKQELIAHVNENQPKFKEIVKKDTIDKENINKIVDEQMVGWKEDFEASEGRPPTEYEKDIARESTEADVRNDMEHYTDGNRPKYGDYQLPGGTNYREHLTTMPDPRDMMMDKYAELQKASRQRKLTLEEKEEYNALDRALSEQNSNTSNLYYSSHWDEPNVIVHTRMNDRNLGGTPKEQYPEITPEIQAIANKIGEGRETHPGSIQSHRDDIGYAVKNKLITADEANKMALWHVKNNDLKLKPQVEGGLKSLHAEEFQSDLHQEGRKKGYKGEAGKLVNNPNRTPQEEARFNNIIEHGTTGGIPDFPFKKSWPDLAIKRWLREAVDNDYDAVSWTPGEAQRDRFQLGRRIEQLHYEKLSNGTYLLAPINREGREVPINRGLPIKEKDLAQYLGEAVAEKVKKGEGKRDNINSITTLENADLKVGGEGLVSFYDKTVKGKVEALVEKYGGKVEKHALPGYEIHEPNSYNASLGEGVRVDNNYNNNGKVPLPDKNFKTRAEAEKWIKDHGSIWSVKLTPELKRAIRSEGFTMFSSGLPLVPVDHDPFDKKQKPKPKLEPVEHDPFAVPTPDMGGALNKLMSNGYQPKPRPIQNGFGVRNEGR